MESKISMTNCIKKLSKSNKYIKSIDKFKYIKMNFLLGYFLKNKNHVKEELLFIKRYYKGTENISHHLGQDIYIHATDQGLNIKIYHKYSSKIKNLIEKWEKKKTMS